MKKNLRYTLAAILISICGSTMAQNLNSAYFLDGFATAHELNPARDYERKSYFSMPLLFGNTNISLSGNIGLADVLRPNPNGSGLVTFLHPDISVADALDRFGSKNSLNADIRYDLLSFGFHAWGGFNTFNLSIRETSSVSAPYELFEALKDLQNKDYYIGDFGSRATAYIELGLGHSRQVTDAVRVGGKVKALIGGGRADLCVRNMSLKLAAPDKWILEGEADMDAAIKGFTWGEQKYVKYSEGWKEAYEKTTGEKAPEGYNKIDFNNINVKNTGVNGGGLAFDLGVEWDLEKQGYLKGMKLSASLLDLGFIHWNQVNKASNKGQTVVFEGFKNIKSADSTSDGQTLENITDNLGDQMSDLVNLQDMGETSTTEALGATLNIGVEYKLPYYDKLKFGLLSTTRIQGMYTWNEERISANVAPLSWLEGGINLGVGTLGTSFGWVLNIHPKGFNFFIGMDRLMSKMTKQGIPKGSTNICLGINFPLGDKL